MNWFSVAAADSLALGQCRTVEVQGRQLVLVHVGEDFHALDNLCPHRGAPMGAGYLEGNTLYCPMHGWDFNVTTGACGVRPDRPLVRYPVRVENGEVQVQL